MIEVRLFATFRVGREKIIFFSKEEVEKSGDIVRLLDIPPEEVAILLINGRHRKLDTPVKDGDVVALFPPVGGG